MRLDLASMTVHDLKHPMTILKIAFDVLGQSERARPEQLAYSKTVAAKAMLNPPRPVSKAAALTGLAPARTTAGGTTARWAAGAAVPTTHGIRAAICPYRPIVLRRRKRYES